MNEAPFSATWVIYRGSHEMRVTARSESSAADLFAGIAELEVQAARYGYGTIPGVDSGIKTIITEGAVIGEYLDKQGQPHQCLYLYGTGGQKFKVATVYPEKLDALPQWAKDAIAQVKERKVVSTAPEKERAIALKQFIRFPQNLIVEQEPRLSADGTPITGDNGKIQYRVRGFREDGLPGRAQPAQAADEDAPPPMRFTATATADLPF